MNLKKLFIMFSMTLLLSTSIVIDFNASEVEITNKTTSKQSTDVFYAPVNSTAEEVEAAADTDIVVFKDNNLKQSLSNLLGIAGDEITVGDMKGLKMIALGNQKISNLTGLEYAINAMEIKIWDNQISDISPLSGLTNLVSLDLSYNQISDISPLSGLIHLDYLNLEYNQISDISPLSGLTNLTSLELGNNQISDISPLSGFTSLEYLSLNFNQISDISPLPSFNHYYNLLLHDQSINLDDITVYIDDELFYTITDIYGNEHQISLGTPQKGTLNMEGDWYIENDNPIIYYTGYIYQNVTYVPLTGNDTANTTEEKALSDEKLIDLFGVINRKDVTITVDQSIVDYSTPGDYDVIFTDTDSNEFIGTLTITDVLPTLDIERDSVTIKIGKTLEDILSQFDYSATEITAGDLTDIISIDDTAVDYATAGDYDLIFTVVDEEGNSINKTITVTIVEDSTDIIDPETPEEKPEEKPEENNPDEESSEDSADEVIDAGKTTDEVTEATSEDATEDSNSMSLAKTGGNNEIMIIIALLTILIATLKLKRLIRE